MFLTDRDSEILRTLALKVRLLTKAQLVARWWPHTADRTKPTKAVQRLIDGGFLERYYVNVRHLRSLRNPIFTWQPGQPPPDVKQLVSRLQNRWTYPPRIVAAYIASKFTGDWLGGRGGLLRRDDASHDIHVTALYLHFLATDREAAEAWVGEDLRPKAGYRVKDPDAFLEYSDGRPTVIIEFGGAYDARRVQAFHKHCAEKELRYQLW